MNFFEDKKDLVDKYLSAYLPPENESQIAAAMRYAVLNGGKRIRPVLALAAIEALKGNISEALPAVSAVELIHAFSLIHDDLPAMDNDDFRRGMPTLHKKFGEALAILAGDALCVLAFQLLAEKLPANKVAPVSAELAQAAGASGMCLGQELDLSFLGKEMTLEQLQQVHRLKTGKLIRGAVRIGAIMGEANSEQLQQLTIFAESIGLAFQIADDILDFGEDKARPSYPRFLGLEKTTILMETERKKANEALTAFGKNADRLRELADFVVERNI